MWMGNLSFLVSRLPLITWVMWKDGKEDVPLDAKSPFWMEIRMVDGDGKPTKVIPLKDGYFEMQLPEALFEGNPKSITINWIDFYRN